jgi:hypothetical protein
VSVPNEAINHIRRAREHMDGAIMELSMVVVQRVDGFEDYKATFVQQLENTLLELLRLRRGIE